MLPAIPTIIPMPFAQNGERRVIPEINTTPGSADASWATGFPPVTRINKQAGGKPPYGIDFQGLFHTICEHLFYAQSGNIMPWVGASDGQPGLNYLKSAIVQGSDGEIYMALKPSGPDTPDSDGTGMVGPVDPVGDESGHWIPLKLLFAGAPNSETWITESGSFTVPVTGWYEVTCFNGGNSGSVSSDTAIWVAGGNSGASETKLMYLQKDEIIDVTIGAGGVWQRNSSGTDSGFHPGGATTFKNFTPSVKSSFAGQHDAGGWAWNVFEKIYAVGGGPGGGDIVGDINGTYYGAGGAATQVRNSAGTGPDPTQTKAGNGYQGAVRLRFCDPAKAAGPAPASALFAARRMLAPRAAADVATVNLYDPETGQGSVWRAEDAEAKRVSGLITEAAWLEICAAKAAEERAAWLADPDSEAERFAMLRAARDVRLAATDYLVAPDYPLTETQRTAVTAYRQALRDLPAQEGAPWDGGGEGTPWPEMPAFLQPQDA